MKRFIQKAVPFCFIIALLSNLGGCAPKAVRQASGPMDTPQHHVFSGMKLLDRMQVDEATREFNFALELDPRYSPAYEGLGLALGQKKDFKPGFDAMANARKYSKNKEDEAKAYVGFMRLYTVEKEKGWLGNVESNFGNALLTVENMPEAHYYMGVAFKEAFRFDDAEREFKKVLALNKTLVGKADDQLKVVQKIQRAMPGTEVGKKMALQDQITRADCAAIFVHELRLAQLYKREKPVKMEIRTMPSDISEHFLKTDIEEIVTVGLRGLEVFPGGEFRPNDPVTRGAYAMMIEDIISVITREPKLSVKHIGSPSPFADLTPDLPYFNAVIVCSTRGIMEADSIDKSNFNPMGKVSGADALLTIRKLREALRIP